MPTAFRVSALALVVSAIAALWSAAPCRADGIAIHSGQKLAFLGDSITQFGWEHASGYLHLVVNGLETCGIKVIPIPAGISGNTSRDMLGRLQRDVLAKKPDWLTISCGVNDVWHNPGGVPLEEYQKNMTEIVDRAQAAGIKVMILTATMIYEDQANSLNQRLIPYNAFLRELAARKHCLLADVGADMQARIHEAIAHGHHPGHLLTVDGVHMNPVGNMMMATAILQAFGLEAAQLHQVRQAWLDKPAGWTARVTCTVSADKPLTLGQYLKLRDQALAANQDVPQMLQNSFQKDANAILSAGGTHSPRQRIQDQFTRDVDQRLGSAGNPK